MIEKIIRRKCDRCGKAIGDEEKHVGIFKFFNSVGAKFMVLDDAVEDFVDEEYFDCDSSESKFRVYDVCKECSKQFDVWLKGSGKS